MSAGIAAGSKEDRGSGRRRAGVPRGDFVDLKVSIKTQPSRGRVGNGLAAAEKPVSPGDRREAAEDRVALMTDAPRVLDYERARIYRGKHVPLLGARRAAREGRFTGLPGFTRRDGSRISL